ncbi:conserved hypothetical protein [Leishmania mexicana MHOM/GT/2001/U1103]|uniref:DNA-directed RNA polymerase III subunit RPC3 n=1 Tax=Leishmania mexicana (strain MHOM/GT/2001/U1103) TaxID=929439 RepID=E9AZG1_LEIMU|nr:conserved hypothetical protein [Leishmania mexicana MHOM/GT/2001/U1103]CBZ28361.1 conserved hypothetical protein [Leishmania mexicana MHOM/GT/2001/U1103]
MPLFCVGDVTTRPSEVCEDLAAKPIAAHHQLIISTVTHQLGPLAGAICRILIQSGPMSLKDISDAVHRDEEVRAVAAAAANRASATGEKTTAVPPTHQVGSSFHVHLGDITCVNDVIHEVAVKELVTRLVVHRLIHADPATHLYEIRYGSAILLRVLFPLLLHCARQQYGEAAKCVLLVVYQLGVVPPRAAVQVALSRTPSITRDAIEYAVVRMVEDGWLVPVHNSPTAAPGAATAANAARLADLAPSHPGGNADLWNAATPYCVGLEAALHYLFNDAIEQAVAERYADGRLALTLVRVLRRRVAPNSGYTEAVASFQELAAELPTTAGVRRDRSGEPLMGTDNVPSSSVEALQRCLQRLCQPIVFYSCDAAAPMTSVAGISPSFTTMPSTRALLVKPHSQSNFYAIDHVTAVHLLQETVCERVVYSRYGVLGVRIMKLLLQHHFLEERTLAEQSVATYVKVREVLHQMFKDGFLLQQEVPRTSALVERPAKASVYLWGLSWSATLLPVVRERLAKTLTIAWEKLREAQQQASAVAKPAAGVHPTPAAGSGINSSAAHAEEIEAQWKYGMSRNIQQVLQAQRAVTGLQSCVMSLMRLLLIVDFF